MLTKKLYDAGCDITGIDFSAEMMTLAQRKMPAAKLLQWDFLQEIPPVLFQQTCDFIISTYVLHHLIAALIFLILPNPCKDRRVKSAVFNLT